MHLSIRKAILTVMAGTTLAVGGVGLAAASPHAAPVAVSAAATSQISGCIETSSRIIENTHVASSVTCPGHDTHLTWNVQGPKGAKGAPGPAGPAGPQGPSGVVSATTYDLLANETNPDSTMTINAGGSFTTGNTLVDTINLSAGTYLVSVDFKGVALTDGGVGAQITPQLFVYNGTAKIDFSNDLFNVGGGDLQPATTNHDSYYSGTQIVTVPTGGETLNIYGFGYLDNSGSGTWGLEKGSVLTAVQLNPGS